MWKTTINSCYIIGLGCGKVCGKLLYKAVEICGEILRAVVVE